MELSHYRIGANGALTTEFSLRVDRLAKAGMDPWAAMEQVANSWNGRELLALDDAWRWAFASGSARYLPESMRDHFVSEFAPFDYVNTPQFACAVDRRSICLEREGMNGYDALITAMSQVHREWMAA